MNYTICDTYQYFNQEKNTCEKMWSEAAWLHNNRIIKELYHLCNLFNLFWHIYGNLLFPVPL